VKEEEKSMTYTTLILVQ